MSDALTDAIAQPIPILPWLGVVITVLNSSFFTLDEGMQRKPDKSLAKWQKLLQKAAEDIS